MRTHLLKYAFLVFFIAFFSGGLYAQKKKKPDSDALLKQIKTEMDINKDYKKALSLSRSAADQYPDNVDFRFLLGRAYLLNSDYQNAQRVLDEVVKKAPGYKDAYIAAANVQLAQDKGDEALKYINKGLDRFGSDRDLRIKKLSVYQRFNNYEAAGRQADTLLDRHVNDPIATRTFIDYHNEAAAYYQKSGNSILASREYSRVLEIDPKNQEATRGLMNSQLLSGDAQNSLNVINRALLDQPNNYEFLMKKTGLLGEMKRYPEAIETLQQIIKKYPGDSKARKLDVELKLEAARYYKSTDPYFQYQSVLEKSPGNREALDNVINIATSRGQYDDALYWINKALKGGSDKVLLQKKMSLLQKQEQFGQAAVIAERLYDLYPSDGSRESLIELQLILAREFNAQQLYDSALAAYMKIRSVDMGNEQALVGSVNILSGQKRYTEALNLLDELIGYFPGDRALILKKAGILQENEQYEEAVRILEPLLSEDEADAKLRNAIADNLMMSAQQMMQGYDYDGAATAFEKILDLQPGNKDALNSLINIELTRGGEGYSNALHYSNLGLERFAEDRELLLKKSEALFRLGRYEEAYTITDNLRRKYPYNPRIRESYKEQLLTAAAGAIRSGDAPVALKLYHKALELNPDDTTALAGMINVYMGQEQYDSALVYAGHGIQSHTDNAFFLIKRAAALEQQQRYQEAAAAADSIVHLLPESRRYQDYAAYLHGRTYRNQLGIAYLNAAIDSAQSANIASLYYTHYAKTFSLTGRLNFAGRSFGTGLQGELESYIQHGTRWYSFVNFGAANSFVFPKYKASYSLFHNFNKGWEAELGGRWLNFDTFSAWSGVASVSKYLGDFWLNARGFLTFVGDQPYMAASLTARQYLNNKTDFFFTSLGYGNSPDDFSRVFQLGTIIDYTTYSIAAGYQKMFHYRNAVTISGTWFNQRIGEGRYRNQYDIYLAFSRKF